MPLLLLVLIFIVLPIAELYVIIQVGQAIGAIPTIAILILDSFIGAWLWRHQGRAAWRRFNEALEAGRVPAREVLDGTLVIFGGALLITPGFISDIVGIFLLLPPTRAVVRRVLAPSSPRPSPVPGVAGPPPAPPARPPRPARRPAGPGPPAPTAPCAGAGFSARFEGLAAPMEFPPESAVARAGGPEGYEQLCAVEAEVTVDGRRSEVRCLGQRDHAWGAPRWDRIEQARTVSAWLSPERAIALHALRPAGADGHEDEAVSAALVEADPAHPDEGPGARAESKPRLSTTYDGEGHQRRAGLELWVDEEDQLPRRAGGTAVCGTTLDLGRLRLDTAFFSWSMEGHTGLGRYDVVRRADA